MSPTWCEFLQRDCGSNILSPQCSSLSNMLFNMKCCPGALKYWSHICHNRGFNQWWVPTGCRVVETKGSSCSDRAFNENRTWSLTNGFHTNMAFKFKCVSCARVRICSHLCTEVWTSDFPDHLDIPAKEVLTVSRRRRIGSKLIKSHIFSFAMGNTCRVHQTDIRHTKRKNRTNKE